ncbi:50S ribosomal protein L10 [Candidatus Woesearchaeota archaeon]|nr:MAG: 50S ribosomal protein L10 [Candidatus Woesearchaeota archaeon]
MAHVSDSKKKIVAEYTKLVKEYPIVGAVNMAGLPAAQLQNMREQLRDKVVLKVGKRRLIKIALEEAKVEGTDKLVPFLEGQPALLFTRDNPFNLFKILKKNKSNAPAKAGQIAPKDIVIPAGPTGFAPGPVIGELGAIGVKAGIDGGKVAVKEDAVVVKKGDEIKANVAAMLTRLKIEPMEVGLDLTAVCENGEIFEASILDINEQEYLDNITTGHRWSFNLAMFAGIPTVETTEIMVQNAFRDAKALAVSQFILADGVVEDIVSRSYSQMLGVAGVLSDDALSDDLKQALSAAPAASAAPVASETTTADNNDDKKDSEPEKTEEDAGAGLGALFG